MIGSRFNLKGIRQADLVNTLSEKGFPDRCRALPSTFPTVRTPPKDRREASLFSHVPSLSLPSFGSPATNDKEVRFQLFGVPSIAI